jgi:hypothetical protein
MPSHKLKSNWIILSWYNGWINISTNQLNMGYRYCFRSGDSPRVNGCNAEMIPMSFSIEHSKVIFHTSISILFFSIPWRGTFGFSAEILIL